MGLCLSADSPQAAVASGCLGSKQAGMALCLLAAAHVQENLQIIIKTLCIYDYIYINIIYLHTLA